MLKPILTLLLTLVVAIAPMRADDLELLRNRFKVQAASQTISPADVLKLTLTCNNEGMWPGIDYEDVSNTGFQHSKHMDNLLKLAIAYTSDEYQLKGNKAIKATFDRALALWIKNDYFCENWWHNQIGIPNTLVNVMLTMDDNLSSEQIEGVLPVVGRAHLLSTGARPGGDRIKIASILARKALFLRDKELFDSTVKVIASQIDINTDPVNDIRRIENAPKDMFPGGRGIEADYSFHHRPDRVNNTVSYGEPYAAAFTQWAAILHDTEYRFSQEAIKGLVDFYLDGICTQLVFGITPDTGAKNRDISRPSQITVNSNPARELLEATTYRKAELENIIKLRSNDGGTIKSFAKFFQQAEHFVFQRPEYYTSVRMYSKRVSNMEEPFNGEGLKNHFRGDGASYLSTSVDAYANTQPMYDWFKIPGTTTVQLEEFPPVGEIIKRSTTDFVGGVSDGLYGAASFDFVSPHTSLKAKKSWFFFDEGYVCLGANISADDEQEVVTTIEQNSLNDIKYGTSWVINNNSGYILEEGTYTLSTKEQSGSWYDINNQSYVSKEVLQAPIFKLWINHGIKPKNASYQYTVLPATTPKKIKEYIKNPSIEVLANNGEMQAVGNAEADIYYIVFYQAGKLKINPNLTVESSAPAMVMLHGTSVKEVGDSAKLVVSDPTRKLSSIDISINGKKSTIALPSGVYAGSSFTNVTAMID